MRRPTILAAVFALAVVLVAVLASTGAGRDDDQPGGAHLRDSGPGLPASTWETQPAGRTTKLAKAVADARQATARYAFDLGRAKADGYRIITRMIPDMGYHYMDPTVTGFDVRRPPILVYLKRGRSWQLGALEWVFEKKPARPPLPGATYGSFAAACHYTDGTFVPEDSEQGCPGKSPETGAAFGFWHPDLVTLHVWVWYPNPDGLFAGMNPFVAPFNEG